MIDYFLLKQWSDLREFSKQVGEYKGYGHPLADKASKLEWDAFELLIQQLDEEI